MITDLTKIFCDIDDFCNQLQIESNNGTHSEEDVNEIFPFWNSLLENTTENSVLSVSEIMTIMIAFHASNYRTFKHFYINYVSKFLRKEFPNLVSYPRFIALQKAAIVPLCMLFNQRKGENTGCSFSDSTRIIVVNRHSAHSEQKFYLIYPTFHTPPPPSPIHLNAI